MRRLTLAALTGVLFVGATACGSSSSGESGSGASKVAADSCKDKTLTTGKLTVATGQPSYSPWVIDDKPESGEGFEAATAYAVAAKMGFAPTEVTWVRSAFDAAIAPGLKSFDFNLQQYSITPDREKVVSFSDPYYVGAQALVTLGDSKFAGAKTVAELKSAKLGAATGTTSLDTINSVVKPEQAAAVFNTNEDAKAALVANQIDGLVMDLPTAFGVAYGELDNGAIPGQFPADSKLGGDRLALLFAKDSPLVGCANAALAALKADGTMAALDKQWLQGDNGVAVFG